MCSIVERPNHSYKIKIGLVELSESELENWLDYNVMLMFRLPK